MSLLSHAILHFITIFYSLCSGC